MDYGIFQPYQSMNELPDKIEDINRALRLGIVVEEKSVKFYQSCMDNLSASVTKQEVGNIIEEEKRHKILLESLLAK